MPCLCGSRRDHIRVHESEGEEFAPTHNLPPSSGRGGQEERRSKDKRASENDEHKEEEKEDYEEMNEDSIDDEEEEESGDGPQMLLPRSRDEGESHVQFTITPAMLTSEGTCTEARGAYSTQYLRLQWLTRRTRGERGPGMLQRGRKGRRISGGSKPHSTKSDRNSCDCSCSSNSSSNAPGRFWFLPSHFAKTPQYAICGTSLSCLPRSLTGSRCRTTTVWLGTNLTSCRGIIWT